jgi:hypothetical protein
LAVVALVLTLGKEVEAQADIELIGTMSLQAEIALHM